MDNNIHEMESQSGNSQYYGPSFLSHDQGSYMLTPPTSDTQGSTLSSVSLKRKHESNDSDHENEIDNEDNYYDENEDGDDEEDINDDIDEAEDDDNDETEDNNAGEGEDSHNNEHEDYNDKEDEDENDDEDEHEEIDNYQDKSDFEKALIKKKIRKPDHITNRPKRAYTKRGKGVRKTKKAKSSKKLSKESCLKNLQGKTSGLKGMININDTARQGFQKDLDDSDVALELDGSSRLSHILNQIANQAPEHLQETALEDAVAINCLLKNFKIVNRRRAVGYDESHDKWTLAGFKTPLYIHQVTGAAFVLGREKNRMERIIECDGEDRLPKKGGKIDEDISENGHAKLMPNPTGGMILDLMGLGKTVTILAAITSAKRSKLPRSTLIVVPKALREQWWHEIKKHCDIDQVESCIRFDVWNRTIENAKTKGAKLYKSFLVLATYNEVIRYNLQKPSKSWWWYRVVLDEAHCIKNHLSLTAKLMVEIKAENRWLMTGTPLLNTKDELFSYFRFLKIDSMTNIRNFHKYFDLATEIGQQRMDTVLSKISIQRDYATTILGRKVVRMPSKTEYIHFVEPDPFTSVILKIFRKKWRDFIGQRLQLENVTADDVEESYSDISNPLQSQSNEDTTEMAVATPNVPPQKNVKDIIIYAWGHIRRLENHFLLCKDVLKERLTREDIQLLIEEALKHEGFDKMFQNQNAIVQKRKQLMAEQKQLSELSDEYENCSIQDESHIDNRSGGSHGLTYEYTKYLDQLAVKEETPSMQVCAFCNLVPEKPHILTPCKHASCWVCFRKASSGGSPQCNACETEIIGMPTPISSFQLKYAPKVEKKPTGWLSLTKDDGSIPASAKTIAAKAQIMNWLSEDEHTKVIVFSHHIQMLDIMAAVCKSEHWTFVKYHGKVAHKDRDEMIKLFSEGNFQILLASSQSGGTGLNLTVASRVLILDPWWNKSSEMQAFNRIFRIQQEKDCHMTRLISKGYIEEYMLELQAKKLVECSNDDNGASLADMAGFFGKVQVDESGKIIGFESDEPQQHDNDQDDEFEIE